MGFQSYTHTHTGIEESSLFPYPVINYVHIVGTATEAGS